MLHGFVKMVPRLAAPVVEPARLAEYRSLRGEPIHVYRDGREFGAGGAR